MVKRYICSILKSPVGKYLTSVEHYTPPTQPWESYSSNQSTFMALFVRINYYNVLLLWGAINGTEPLSKRSLKFVMVVSLASSCLIELNYKCEHILFYSSCKKICSSEWSFYITGRLDKLSKELWKLNIWFNFIHFFFLRLSIGNF